MRTDPRCSMPTVVAFTIASYLSAAAMAYALVRYSIDRVTGRKP